MIANHTASKQQYGHFLPRAIGLLQLTLREAGVVTTDLMPVCGIERS